MVTHVHIVIILVGVFCSGMSFSLDNVLHSVTISSLRSVNKIPPIRAASNAQTSLLNRVKFIGLSLYWNSATVHIN